MIEWMNDERSHIWLTVWLQQVNKLMPTMFCDPGITPLQCFLHTFTQLVINHSLMWIGGVIDMIDWIKVICIHYISYESFRACDYIQKCDSMNYMWLHSFIVFIAWLHSLHAIHWLQLHAITFIAYDYIHCMWLCDTSLIALIVWNNRRCIMKWNSLNDYVTFKCFQRSVISIDIISQSLAHIQSSHLHVSSLISSFLLYHLFTIIGFSLESLHLPWSWMNRFTHVFDDIPCM